MVIQELKLEHSDGIMEVVTSLGEWFDEGARKHIPVDLRYHKGFVSIDENGQVIGFITYFVYEAVGIIGWLGVIKEQQNKGIGSQLLKSVEEVMKWEGIDTIQVYTLGDEVDYKPYESTRRFYRKHGFKDYRRIKTDNPSCPVELYLRRSIGV